MIRLADLRQWHVIDVTCGRCAHRGQQSPATPMQRLLTALRQRYRRRRLTEAMERDLAGFIRVVELQPKLRCIACGNDKDNVLEVRKLPR